MVIRIRSELCNGCGTCVKNCPCDVIRMDENKESLHQISRRLYVMWTLCNRSSNKGNTHNARKIRTSNPELEISRELRRKLKKSDVLPINSNYRGLRHYQYAQHFSIRYIFSKVFIAS